MRPKLPRPEGSTDVSEWRAWHDSKTTDNLGHWRKGRGAIADQWAGNDLAYATSGAYVAAKAIRGLVSLGGLDLTRAFHSGRFLDFGCGTGRVTRPMAFYFRETVGYDPVEDVIELAKRETAPMEQFLPANRIEWRTSMADQYSFQFGGAFDSLTAISSNDLPNAAGLILRYIDGAFVANFYGYQLGILSEAFAGLTDCGPVSPSGLGLGEKQMRVWRR